MKKVLMIAACTMLAVATTKAATVTWQATQQTDKDGNVLSGCVAYLFNTADVTIAQINTAITAAAAGDNASLKTLANSALSTTQTTSTGGISKMKIGNFSNETVELFMVVFDGASIDESSNAKVSAKYSQNFTTTNKTYNFNNYLTGSSWTPSAQAIPEPTTVALLALGLAALGLKRKVA